MHPGWEKDAGRLLQHLEKHWRSQYQAKELRQQLTSALLAVQRALEHDTEDARLIVVTYRRHLRHEAQPQELELANEALKRFLKSLGVAAVGLLPLSFITLPVLFGLARHLGIELLPGPIQSMTTGNDHDNLP